MVVSGLYLAKESNSCVEFKNNNRYGEKTNSFEEFSKESGKGAPLWLIDVFPYICDFRYRSSVYRKWLHFMENHDRFYQTFAF